MSKTALINAAEMMKAAQQQAAQESERRKHISSILAVDIGSVHTRAILIDRVDGQYRLVSRAQSLTTASPPVGDASEGLRRALEQMGQQISRPFLNNKEIMVKDRRGGAEAFLATASGGRPMKVVVVGLTPDVSIATGRRALASIYAELVDTLSLNDVRSVQDQINAILRREPDLIFIVGGTNHGAVAPMRELLETVKLAVLLARGHKPSVIYSGNEALRPMVYEYLASEVSLFMVDNIRPSLEEERIEPVQFELGMVYGLYRASGPGGFEEVHRLSEMGILPTAQSTTNVIRYLGLQPEAGLGVLYVDVGSSTVSVTASVKKQLHVAIRPDLGVGHSAVSGVKAVGPANVRRWLSFNATDNDVLDYAWNKTLRPSTVPQTPEDLEFEYAIARELIRNAVGMSRAMWQGVGRGVLLPAMRPIIGAGSILAQPINPGISALIMLDALQPVGVVELKLDPYGVIPALGNVAYLEPLATVQVLETGGLLSLGTVISPFGNTGAANAMEVTVKYASGRSIQRTVPRGSLKMIPLPAGQRAQVTIKLSRGLSLNGKGRLTLTVQGGAAGLIFDGRGRPFSVPKDKDRRAAALPRWYAAVQSAE